MKGRETLDQTYHEGCNVSLFNVIATVLVQSPVSRKFVMSLRVDFVRALNTCSPSNNRCPGVVGVSISMNT